MTPQLGRWVAERAHAGYSHLDWRAGFAACPAVEERPGMAKRFQLKYSLSPRKARLAAAGTGILAFLIAFGAPSPPALSQASQPAAGPSASISGGLAPVSRAANPLAAQASTSVLRIISFANEGNVPPARVATATLPPLPLGALRYPLPVEMRAAFQGEACRLNGLEWCPVFKEETRGTAFSADRPGRFMTCRHLVQDWLHWARAYNPGSEGREIIPPFALADSEGRLSFVSVARGGGGFRLSFFAQSRRLERPLTSLLRGDLFWDADFLQFDLASDLGVPPLRRRESLDAGERLTLLGYPDRAGAGLATSTGSVTTRDGLTLVTNAPSAKGISGGPMLDDDGLVGGMACSIGRARGPRAVRPALGLPVLPQELASRLRETHGVETIGTP
jgi:hypothetical protein